MLCYKCGSHVPEGHKSCPTCGQSLARGGKENVASATSLLDDKRQRRVSSRAGVGLLSTGDVLSSRYRIIDAIGSGGVGAVYRAHDQDIDVDVALKAVAPKLLQTNEEQKTFSQKVRLARKLHHANIVRIYDDGHDGDQRFFTMQLLEGLTLRKVIELRKEKGQPFIAQEIEPIFQQLVTALEYAHRTTFHGDLKPDNIIILPDLLKLTDFCLIQALPLKPFLAIQKSRGKVFRYIAPEVRLEAQQIDGRADIYSLGVILAEMLTGEIFSGNFDKPFSALLEALPRQVESLLRRALSERPEARFQNVGDFMDALAKVIDAAELDGLRSKPPPPPPPDDDDDLMDGPELISGSSVVLLEDEKENATKPQRVATEDQTPLDRPPTFDANEEAAKPVPAPPPLPSEDDDDEFGDEFEPTKEERRPSALAEEVRLATGEGSDVYQRLTVAEDPDDLPPGLAPQKGNGAGGDPIPSPPPLPPDAGELFPEEEESRSEPGDPLGIHDELTALTPFPEPSPGNFSGPIPSMPTIPPPLAPVVPPMRRPSNNKTFVIGGIVVLLLLAIGIPVYLYISDLQNQLENRRKEQFASNTGESPSNLFAMVDSGATGPDSGGVPAVDASGAAASKAEEERLAAEAKKAEEERLAAEAKKAEEERLAAEAKAAEEARLAEEALAKKAEDEKASRSEAAKEAARLNREEAIRAAKEKKARDEERKAERKRQREEAKRIAEENRRKREEAKEEKRRKAEKAAEEKKRQEKLAREEEQRRKEAKVAALGPDTELKCPRGMARIEAGSFKMGSAPNDPMRNFEERRLEQVEVETFCIDYYEYPNGKKVLPRVNVSWGQAKSLCASRKKRLCTEEEWEKACKGPGNYRYPYGNRWNPDLCNTEDAEGNDRDLDVPKNFAKCRSRYGPINMSGNASEWTASKFSPGLKDKVHKGGAANKPNWAARCANRGNLSPGERNGMLGFRCCADPS